MKKILFISIITFVVSAPFSRMDERMDPADDEEEDFSYVKPSNDIELAWEVGKHMLTLPFKISKKYKWMVIGFHSNNKKEISSLEQALFFRVRDGGLTVKVCNNCRN